MHVKYLVLGGGITGRIVQSILKDSWILESKEDDSSNLSFNFGTNYLWKPIPGFEVVPVHVSTRVDEAYPTKESILRYKNKVGKGGEDWGLQFEPESTGYLITGLPIAKISYRHRVVRINPDIRKVEIEISEKDKSPKFQTFFYHYLISTIPLVDLIRLCGLETQYPLQTSFIHRNIYVKVVPRPENYVSSDNMIYVNYVSNPLTDTYRYCDRGNKRHCEYLNIPGGFPYRKLYPGKLWSSPFISIIRSELKQKNIFCFGRYGKWNPNELLHETYEEVKAWKN